MELWERAVRLAVEARRDPAARPGACRRIGEQLGINPEMLRGWVTQAEIDVGHRPGTTTSDAQRLAQLEQENGELRRTNDLLNGVVEDTGTGYRVRARDHLDPLVGLLSESSDAAGEAHRRPAQPTTARLSGSR